MDGSRGIARLTPTNLVRLSDSRVRSLGVEDLELSLPANLDRMSEADGAGAVPAHPEPLPNDHWLSRVAKELLARYGGLILQGPPGTSKSYLAARLAMELAGSGTRVRFIQFHPSYQYEDFIEGPTISQGSIEIQPKHLVEMAEEAEENPELTFVIVIDELSRGDAARIFGEALTYVEKSKRGLSFSLASGNEFAIPENLIFIATMNPHDRGVDEVDAAFERRFAKIALEPSGAQLQQFLEDSGLQDSLRKEVEEFFRFVNERAQGNPYGALGHTYFLGVSDRQDLDRLWDFQLRFLFEKAYQLDEAGLREIKDRWTRMFEPSRKESDAQDLPPAELPAT